MTADPMLVLSGPPFGHLPLLDRLAPAREAGFSAISLMPGDNALSATSTIWRMPKATSCVMVRWRPNV